MSDEKTEEVVVDQVIKDQLEEIRLDGKFNMLDFNGIHREAFKLEYYELVNWMSQVGKSSYGKAVMGGWDSFEKGE